MTTKEQREKWEERVAILTYMGGMDENDAEYEAAKMYGLEDLLDDLRIDF